MSGAGTETIEIVVETREPAWREAVPHAEEICRRAAAAAARAAGAAPGDAEVSVVLADDALLRELNRDWRAIDAPTNVLAFPCDGPETAGFGSGPVLLGDVVLSYQTTAAEAGRDGKSVADHLAHLVAHGVLHLLGHDHETDDEAELMEALETQALGTLGIADPHGARTGATAGQGS